MICDSCGSRGKPRNKTKGSIWIELLVWIIGIALAPTVSYLVIFLPIGYSVWRLITKEKVCPQCEKVGTLIPLSTPMGQELAEKNSEKPSSDE